MMHADRMPLFGFARLMTMAFSGQDLTELASRLVERVRRDPDDASALMDLSTISHLWFKHEIGEATQARALRLRQHYRLQSVGEVMIRLLALMISGDPGANTPLGFLVENSDIALEILYVGPELPLPAVLPEHDLLFVAVGESERTAPVLESIAAMLPSWPRAPINSPRRILRLARESVGDWLQAASGVVIPRTARLERPQLALLAEDKAAPAELLADLEFPLIARPVDSHGGHGLMKLDSREELSRYLQSQSEGVFQVSRFVDYRSADGWFRKYRVVLIGGHAYAVHMGISEHWMIHYINAGMAASADKRAEEARFMAEFERDFGRRHGAALHAIDALAGLDYLVIDCAETANGRLLVFELDTAAIVHAMDPIEIYPYKHAQMRKVFAAFRAFLASKLR
jgi:hypothetical protein